MGMQAVRNIFLYIALSNLRRIFRPNGILFTAAAGTTEFVKRWNPQSGDIVTFKHRGFLLSTKKPKLATLHRLRPDLTWDIIVQNWKEQQPTRIGK